MANISDTPPKDFPSVNIPVGCTLGDGILQPMLMNRWRVFFDLKDPNDRDLVASQIVDCGLDYTTNTFRVSVEQNVHNCDLHVIFKELSKPQEIVDIHVQAMAGDDEPVHSLKLTSCKVMEHSFELDYCKNGAAYHKLVFKFNTIIPYERGCTKK